MEYGKRDEGKESVDLVKNMYFWWLILVLRMTKMTNNILPKKPIVLTQPGVSAECPQCTKTTRLDL